MNSLEFMKYSWVKGMMTYHDKHNEFWSRILEHATDGEGCPDS